jgi:hypothetical protein
MSEKQLIKSFVQTNPYVCFIFMVGLIIAQPDKYDMTFSQYFSNMEVLFDLINDYYWQKINKTRKRWELSDVFTFRNMDISTQHVFIKAEHVQHLTVIFTLELKRDGTRLYYLRNEIKYDHVLEDPFVIAKKYEIDKSNIEYENRQQVLNVNSIFVGLKKSIELTPREIINVIYQQNKSKL